MAAFANIEDFLKSLEESMFKLTPLGGMIAKIENSVSNLSATMGGLTATMGGFTTQFDTQIKLQAMTVNANNMQIKQNTVLNNIATQNLAEGYEANVLNQTKLTLMQETMTRQTKAYELDKRRNEMMETTLKLNAFEALNRANAIPAIIAQATAIGTVAEQTNAMAESIKQTKKEAYDALNPFQKLAHALGESEAGSFTGKLHRFGYAFIPFYFTMKSKTEMLARTAGIMWEGLFGNDEDGKPKTGLGLMVQGVKKQMKLLRGIDPSSPFRKRRKDGTKRGMKRQIGDFISEANPLYKLLRNPIKSIDKAVTFSFKFLNKIHKGFWKLIKNGLILGAVIMKYMIIIGLIAIGARMLWNKSGMTLEKLKVIATKIWDGLKQSWPFIEKGLRLIWEGISTIFGAWFDIILGKGDPMDAVFTIIKGIGTLFEGIFWVWYGIFGLRVKQLGEWLFANKEAILTWVGEKTIEFIMWFGDKLSEYWGKLVKKYEESSEKTKKIIGWIAVIVGFIILIAVAISIFVTAVATFPVWFSILLVVIGSTLILWGITKLTTAFDPLINMLENIWKAINPKDAIMSIFGMADGGIAKGGLTMVGEEGPELVNLNKGSRVYSNTDTKSMLSNGSTTNITVNVQGRIGASDGELRQIAEKVGRMINKEINRTTSSSTTR